MMKTKVKFIVKGTILLLILLAAIWLLQCLLVPKYMSKVPEGALIAEYYNETKMHDVMFVGDCEVYENFSPIILWEQFGITSYIRGSAQQLIWQSYYLLEDTFRYEVPEAVVFNVLAMKYGEPQSEAYNRLNIDGMKLTTSKLKCIQASMSEGETFISYIFPLLRYHSRWQELGREDFKYMFYRDTIGFNGYLMQRGARPAKNIPIGVELEDYEFSDICWEYLDKMRELCEERGIKFILIKAPSLYPYWYEEWDRQIVEYAEEHQLKYYNLLDKSHDAGIDWETDTYDMGLHLNVFGAEKLSAYFGEILANDIGITNQRGDAELELVWSEKTTAYYLERDKGVSTSNE